MKLSTIIPAGILAFSLATGTFVATAAAASPAIAPEPAAAPAVASASAANIGWTDEMKSFLAELPATAEGQQNAYVLGLQSFLIKHGYQLTGTAYFGSATRAAVVDWQRDHGINPSGLVGTQTWASVLAEQLPHWTDPLNGRDGLGLFPSSSVVTMQPGMTWPSPSTADGAFDYSAVTTTISSLHSWFPSWAETATAEHNVRYTGAQVRDVQRLQARVGIAASGIIGPQTSEAIRVLRAIRGF